jgi:hypothetical protein
VKLLFCLQVTNFVEAFTSAVCLIPNDVFIFVDENERFAHALFDIEAWDHSEWVCFNKEKNAQNPAME